MPPCIGQALPIRKCLSPTLTDLALALGAMGLISVTFFLIFKYNLKGDDGGRKKRKEKDRGSIMIVHINEKLKLL